MKVDFCSVSKKFCLATLFALSLAVNAEDAKKALTFRKKIKVDEKTAYVIEEAKQISIDGDGNDYGFTDNLHIWHAPKYITFGSAENCDHPELWKGKEDISGKIVLKLDEKNLYVFAEVIDDMPMNLGRGDSRWEKDALELFLSFIPHEDGKINYAKGDYQVQIATGNGKDIKPSVFILAGQNNGGRKVVKAKGCEIVARESQIAVGDKTFRGWVMEAKLPLVNFPEYNAKRGCINFCMGVSDADGTKINKCWIAKHKKPFAKVEDWYAGYIYKKQELYSGYSLVLGNGAVNALVPEKFLPANLKGKQVHVWDMALAEKKKTGVRESICLDGLWGVQSFKEKPTDLKDGAWDYLAVPIDLGSHFFQPYFSLGKGNVLNLKMHKFKYTRRTHPYRAYFREFTLPESWKGKQIWLDIELRGIICNAAIYLNGKLVVDEKQKTGQSVNLTPYLSWDKKNKLTIIANSLADHKTAPGRSFQLSLGDIWLFETDTPTHIKDAFVKTSISKKEITIDAGVIDADKKDLSIQAEVVDPKTGKKVLSLPAVSFKKAAKGNGEYGVSATWENPKLWSPEHPNLYIAKIDIKEGSKIIDSYDQRFGFREIAIKGKELLLNGKPVHLKMMHMSSRVWDYDYLKFLKEQGVNSIVYIHGAIKHSYLYNWADELGIIVIAQILNGVRFCKVFKYDELNKKWLHLHRNHPSIAAWMTTALTVGGRDAYGWAHWNYQTMGTNYFPEKSEEAKKARKKNNEDADWVKSIDPTRPVTQYCAGNQDDISTTMNHADFGMPIQEAGAGSESWYKEKGGRPYFMLESWTAPTGDNIGYVRKNGLGHVSYWATNETGDFTNMIEELSQYLGEEAYSMAEPVRTRRSRAYESHCCRHWERNKEDFIFEEGKNKIWKIRFADATIAMNALAIREHARGDRTYGLTGRNYFEKAPLFAEYMFVSTESLPGYNTIDSWYQPLSKTTLIHKRKIKPFFLNHPMKAIEKYLPDMKVKPVKKTKYSDYFKDALSDVLIYIGGGPEAYKFRYKDHAYYSGEKIDKHVIIVNDKESAIELSLKIKLLDSKGKAISEIDKNVNVGSGKVARVPFSFATPAFFKRTDLQISLKADLNGGKEVYKDSFAIQVFPKDFSKNANLKVYCYDSSGKTLKLLERLGLKVTRLKAGDSLDVKEPLVIGRNSLSSFLAAFSPKDFSEKIKDGLKVLVMEQGGDSVSRPWQKELRLRRQFIKMPKHPVFNGLKDEDFANWRGSSQLTEAYPEWEKATEYSSYAEHQDFSKWGNEGIVSTMPLLRPEHGNYRALLTGGYDQDWAGLSEYFYGKGILLMNQLDICGRTQIDPAADAVLCNIIKYLETYKAADYGALCYVGDAADKALLERFDPLFVDDPEKAKFIAVDGKNDKMEEKKKCLDSVVKKDGATMLVLFPNEKSDMTWISDKIKIGKIKDKYKQIYKVDLKKEEKDMELFAGINNEDLYMRYFRPDQPLVKEVPSGGKILAGGMAAIIPEGKGKVMLWLFNPADQEGRRSFRKAIRCLANIMTSYKVRLNWDLSFSDSPLELSSREWAFKIDPQKLGVNKKWAESDYDDSSWKKLRAGLSWERQGINDENPFVKASPTSAYDGYAWYRVKFDVPKEYQGSDLELYIFAVAGEDTVYCNGKEIGHTTYQNAGSRNCRKCVRLYKIPADLLKPAGNAIAILVNNKMGPGGLNKLPIRIMARNKANKTFLFPMELERKPGNPYRFVMW